MKSAEVVSGVAAVVSSVGATVSGVWAVVSSVGAAASRAAVVVACVVGRAPGTTVTLTALMLACRALIVSRPVGTSGDLFVGTRERPARILDRCFNVQLAGRRVEIPIWLVLFLVVVAAISPGISIALAALIFARSFGSERRTLRARQRAWSGTVPDLVELVRLAISSGCSTHQTLALIAQHAGGDVSDMLRRTSTSLREGLSTAEALTELQERVGASVRPLCSALLGSERYGLPVAATLEALAVEARLSRQRDAELRSRRLPVLLIFPLVTCILPAFALLTVVPLLGGGLSSLSW